MEFISITFWLLIVSAMPIGTTVILSIFDRRTKFGNINYVLKQIIIGVIFGFIAILLTELGIDYEGATINVRDAAPICAGLIFGGPAGIIAGVIGGVERYFAVLWGAGEATRIACAISTILAGVFSAVVRKFLFENKIPTVGISICLSLLIEVTHMFLVYTTSDISVYDRYNIIHACTAPMIVTNATAVAISIASVHLMFRSIDSEYIKKMHRRISYKMQVYMLLCVGVSFVITTVLNFVYITSVTEEQVEDRLMIAVTDIKTEFKTNIDEAVIMYSEYTVKAYENGMSIDGIKQTYELDYVDVIDENGIIVDSTSEEEIGVDISQIDEDFDNISYEDEHIYVKDYENVSDIGVDKRKYAGAKTSSGKYLQIGFNEESINEFVNLYLESETKFKHVGQYGFIVIVDEYGNIISNQIDREEYNINDFGIDFSDKEEGEVYSISLKKHGSDDVNYYIYYVEEQGVRIVGFLPEEEAVITRNIEIYLGAFLEIMVFAILFILLYILIRKLVVKNIISINKSLSRITSGDLDEVVDVRSSSEFASLSDDINSTVDTLKKYIKDAENRVNEELEFAKNIQMSALPHMIKPFVLGKPFNIYANMYTAKEVGGDFYDFYFLGKDKIVFLVADVSGKGIPAAMFMMTSKTTIRGFVEAGLDIADAFTNANDRLCENNNMNMFVTAWLGMLDLNTGHLEYVNAGHNAPLIRRGNGDFEYLKGKPGFVLAGLSGFKYEKQELDINYGDFLFLYTDGVTEATNISNELYGENRLLEVINEMKFDNPKTILRKVKEDVDSFVDIADQFDDITMLGVYYGNKRKEEMVVEANASNLAEITRFIHDFLEPAKCDKKLLYSLDVSIEELFVNICNYAYPVEEGDVKVVVDMDLDNNQIEISFIDSGIPYNPLEKTDPDIMLSAEDREIGGLGIFMIKNFMDKCEYIYEDNHNIFTIIKNL